MNYSDYRKGPQIRTPVASGTGDNATALQTVLQLNKDYLTSEYIIDIVASRAFSVAPTGYDPAAAISSVTLEFMGGKNGGNGPRIVLDGREFYEIMRFTEAAQTPILTTLATPATLQFGIDMHQEMDESRADLMTAVWTADYTQIKLTINWASGASPFIGGTMTGNVSYTVSVSAIEMPVVPQAVNADKIGIAKSVYMSATKTAGGAGNGDDMLLETGNKTRFIMVSSNVAGTYDDGVINEIYFNFGGYNFRHTFLEIKQDNQRNRGYSQTGFAVIDFGDDPLGWLPMEALNEARLKWTALKAGTVKFTQVSMQTLNGQPIALA